VLDEVETSEDALPKLLGESKSLISCTEDQVLGLVGYDVHTLEAHELGLALERMDLAQEQSRSVFVIWSRFECDEGIVESLEALLGDGSELFEEGLDLSCATIAHRPITPSEPSREPRCL
jgi:hypothetical protein